MKIKEFIYELSAKVILFYISIILMIVIFAFWPVSKIIEAEPFPKNEL